MSWWLVQNTLLAGVLALAATLAGRFGRFSPAVRHALWLVVLVKLITPPVAFYSLPESGPWSDWLLADAADETHPGAASDVDVRWLHTAEATTEPAEIAAEADAMEIVQFPKPTPVEEAAIDFCGPEVAATPIEFDLGGPDSRLRHGESANSVDANARQMPTFSAIRFVLAAVWALGAAWMVLLHSVRLWRFRRLLQNTKAAPRSFTALVAEIAAQLGVSPPRIELTSAACSPMIFALGRPRLIWPNTLAEPLTGDARRSVIAHELAHLRRRDHWVGWVELAASCGWWWNPLFWYVRRQLRETAELACDAWVVALLPGGRRAYAQALIDVSEMISWTAAPAPAVGMGASARHLFERRLTMILRERVACRAPLAGLALIGLVGIAVLPGWTKGQAPAVENLEVDFTAASEEASSIAEERIEIVAENPETRRESIGERPAEERPIRETAGTDWESPRPTAPRPAPVRNAEEVHLRVHAIGEAVQQRKLAEIKELEARLAALAEELRALRGAEAGFRITAKAPKSATLPQLRDRERQLVISRFSADRLTPDIPGGNIETLTRAKYKLPAGRAEALAAFIKEHVKEDVETRIDGDTLVVTAASDDQARIGQFVQLLKKTPEESRVGRDNVQGSTTYPMTQPIAVDSGFPVPVGETVPANQRVAPPSATPGIDRVDPLPALEESGPKGPLPPPPADTAPSALGSTF